MDAPAAAARAARFSDRFVSYLIDTVPYAAGAVGTVWVLLVPMGRPPTPALVAAACSAWVTLAFGVQLVGNMRGATPGKALMGLRVVRRDGGGELGFGRSLVRALLWLLGSGLANAGFLLALLNRENRALHDYASGAAVVEAYGKSRGEGAAVFAAAALAAIGLFSLNLWTAWSRPTTADLEAVSRARSGLVVIALVQEAHMKREGVFASSLDQLAAASGDPAQFRAAMAELYRTDSFTVEGGNRRWRVKAQARDRFSTPIVREGP
jgi:uncharacterized RDD family membrane protein YckC